MDNHTIIDQQEIQQTQEFNYASNGIRFVNYLIDQVVIFLLVFFTAIYTMPMGLLTEQWGSFVISFIYGLTYYCLIESITRGKSIGKLITGTRALKSDGELPGFGDILKRSLCRYIPFEVFSIFFDAPWHDSIPDMMVVKESSNENI
ncbi:MAG: RDD family protein [Bacteroidota bacterium]